MNASLTEIETVSVMQVPLLQIDEPATEVANTVTNVRKRRSAEEIATEKAEKELKKQQREEKRLEAERKREEIAQKRAETARKTEETARKRAELALKKERHTSPLVPGTNIFAVAAMTIFALCMKNASLTNLAFRRMIASRSIFPPKKNINKFATGGIAEECTTMLLCDVGLDCINMSEDTNVIDLEVKVPVENVAEPVSFKVSLKNSGKLSASPILENYRGQKRQEIRPLPPTFIIYTEMDIKRVRIVYLDEEILRQGYPDVSEEEFHSEIYQNTDSNLTFRSGFLAKFIPRLPAEYILNADYPEDLAGLSERNLSRIALAEVIRQLESTPESAK